MQLVTMTFEGRVYQLGHIMPMSINSKLQFIIVPNFDFRPPFICLRLLHAHRRMYLLALEYLRAGGKIESYEIRKIEAIDPLVHLNDTIY